MGMMQIGRRLFYDLTTGNVICDTGEREGDVQTTTIEEDLMTFPELVGRTTGDTGSVDYAYGDSRFSTEYATAHIDPGTQGLTLYPFASISTTKTQVTANGTDTATVTVSGLSTTDPVTFSVNGGVGNSVTSSAGQAQITFNTQVQGNYTITAQTAKNGTVSVGIQGV
jgi:hypothetical protein